MNKCTHVSNNHNIQFFKIKFQNNFRPIANKCFSNYYIITNLHLFSYIDNSNIVIRGSNPCQNKTACIEVTLHSVCEVKKFEQFTVEWDYKHTSYMTKCNFSVQELSLLISVVTLKQLKELTSSPLNPA